MTDLLFKDADVARAVAQGRKLTQLRSEVRKCVADYEFLSRSIHANIQRLKQVESELDQIEEATA